MKKMPTPKYSIAPVTKPGLPTLADLIHSAKLVLSVNRLIFNNWPNDELQKKTLYKGAIESAYADPAAECFKAVDVDSNEIIGYFVLSRKRPSREQTSAGDDSEHAGRSMPDGLNPGLIGEVSNATAGIAKEVEGYGPVW